MDAEERKKIWLIEGGKFYTNVYNVDVCMGCISCKNGARYGRSQVKCSVTGSIHNRNYLCQMWAIREGLEKAGKGTGRVRPINEIKPTGRLKEIRNKQEFY